MTTDCPLDLTDIQGNILRGYNLPVARHFFYRVTELEGARRLLALLVPEITTAEDAHVAGRWSQGQKPPATVNVALTYRGLRSVGVPPAALAAFPVEFREGMRARASTLVDRGASAPERWERPWQDGGAELCVMLNARTPDSLDRRARWLRQLAARCGGVVPVHEQPAAMLVVDGVVTTKEHFGYTDGFGNPDIAGAGERPTKGGGKLGRDGRWLPIAAGEMLLGHPDEAGEISPKPPPSVLFRNGTYMVYRKLHQNVGTYRRFLREQGAGFAGGPEALAAKLVGRWRDGTPTALSPLEPDPALVADERRNTDFTYGDDPAGARCPIGAHIRRANPRDALGFGGLLVNRRRIMRRGITYGAWTPWEEPGDDTGEHGLLFIAFNASYDRQFEFVQQQWLNYGNAFRLGNDKDALIGNHAEDDRLLIPGDPSVPGREATYVCRGLPSFCETRGGDYFFMPGLNGLRWIAGAESAGPPPRLVPVDDDQAGGNGRHATMPAHLRLRDALADILHTIGDGARALPGDLGAILREGNELAHEDLQRFFAGLKAWAMAQNPEPVFAILRRLAPILVHKDFALVTRFDDVQEVLSRADVFRVPYAQKFAELTDGGSFFLGMDETPEYTRDVSTMRLVIRREDIATRVSPFVARTAERLVAASDGRLDVMADLASVVPTELVGDYIGTPSPPGNVFAPQSAVMSAYLFLPFAGSAEQSREAVAAAAAMRRVLREQIAARKRDRGRRDDVLERCLALQDAGVPGMDDAALLDKLFGIVVGAIPTTAAVVTRIVDFLLDNPEQMAHAQAAARLDDWATVAAYAWESMRLSPLGPGVFRVAHQDYRLASGTSRAKTIPAGATVLAALQSAGFDGTVLVHPDRFRTDRPAYHYMNFGYGLHTCFGQYINAAQIPRILLPLLKREHLRRARGDAGRMRMDGAFPASLVVEFDT